MRTLCILLLVLAAGCGSGEARHDKAVARPTVTDSQTPSATSSPSRETHPADAPTPAPSAGALDSDDVPPASQLGDDWNEYADPGGAEAGFSGNGSFVRARQPDEVVQALVPLGCPGVDRAGRVPLPSEALEATYRTDAGDPAVVLVLEYDDPAGAVHAMRTLAAMRGTCRPLTPGEQAYGRTVIEIQRADDKSLWDRRQTQGDPGHGWLEVAVREGDRVALLAMAADQTPAGGLAGLDRTLRATLQAQR